MTIKEAREATGMNIKEASELLGVPYRTWQNWELGLRICPDYVERLIVEKLMQEEKKVMSSKERDIKVLMADRCTEKEAVKFLETGTAVFSASDFESNFDSYMSEWGMDADDAEEYRAMIEKEKPMMDWSIVYFEDEKYYISYVL